jgi:hypothetical protein
VKNRRTNPKKIVAYLKNNMTRTGVPELKEYLLVLEADNNPYAGLLKVELLKREAERQEGLRGIPLVEAKAIARGDRAGDIHEALYSLKKYDPGCVEIQVIHSRLAITLNEAMHRYTAKLSVQRREILDYLA